MSARYFVDMDGYGDACLWRGDGPSDSACVSVIGRNELRPDQDFLWPLLVGVLTGDDETVERLAVAVSAHERGDGAWQRLTPEMRVEYRQSVRAALRALRGES